MAQTHYSFHSIASIPATLAYGTVVRDCRCIMTTPARLINVKFSLLRQHEAVDLNTFWHHANCGTSMGIKVNFAAVCVDVSNRKDVIVSLPARYF